MKKLELNQMENLEGGIKNRSCFLLGATAGFSLAVAGVLAVTAGVFAAGSGWATFGGGAAVTGIATDCF